MAEFRFGVWDKRSSNLTSALVFLFDVCECERAGEANEVGLITHNYYRSCFHRAEERVFTKIIGYCTGMWLKKTRKVCA